MGLIAPLASILKWTLSLASLPTSAKSFVDNPIIGSPWLNGLGLHEARIRIAARLAEFRRRRLAHHVDEIDRLAFACDGFILKRNFLPAPLFDALRNEIIGGSWDAREMREGTTVTRRVSLDIALLRRTKPNLARFINRKELLSLIRYVAGIGGQPIFSIQCIFANCGSGDQDPQCRIHSDTFHSNAKAWFFLHDVGLSEGPFVYVPGSHLPTEPRLAWEKRQSVTAIESASRDHAEGSFRISAEELQGLGLPAPRPIAVRANTLIIADTFGFHGRSQSSSSTCRIEIYASLRRNPFLPWTSLDPLALPFVKNRIGSTLRLLERLGIVRTRLKPAGRIKLDAPPRDADQEAGPRRLA